MRYSLNGSHHLSHPQAPRWLGFAHSLAAPLTLLILLCIPPGTAQAITCRGQAPTTDSLARLLEQAPIDILSFEAASTQLALETALDELICLDSPVERSQLAQLWYVLGLSHLYAADELGLDPHQSEPAARAAFELAHQVDPDLVWQGALFGDYGQGIWEGAIAAWDAAISAARMGAPAKGYWVEVEAQGWPPGTVYVDGELADNLGTPPTLHRGRHLIQYHDAEGFKGAWADISPEQLIVTLPLPGTLPDLTPSLPPVKAPVPISEVIATKPEPVADASPQFQTPPPPSVTVVPEPNLQPPSKLGDTGKVALGVMLPTWRLPQLFSGPEMHLRLNPTRRLAIVIGAGAAMGAWADCEGCVPKDDGAMSIIFPVRSEVSLRLGNRRIELDLGAAWQGYFGGGFGVTGEESAASAHGYEGSMTLLFGQGPYRGVVRLAGGQLIAPATLAVPQGSIGIGIIKQLNP